jgi:ribulose kinase
MLKLNKKLGIEMIRTTAEISNEDGYKKYNLFEIHESLEPIIADDYLEYSSTNSKKAAYCELMYKKNFYDKYDPKTYEEVYVRYINNEKFKEKAKFIYSVIDYDKYVKFAEENQTIENPNELIISYSVVDSDGVKINIYNISIADIAFVF